MTLEFALLPVLSALLGSVRVVAMMWVGPLFSHPAIGSRFRIMLALAVAWAAAPVSVGRLSGAQWDVASVVGSAVIELLIGLSVGVGAALIFSAMMLLGEFLAVQGGLGAAQAIDPTTGTTSPAIGMALQSFALLIFLAIDGHHDLIRGIAATFEFLPVGGAAPSPDLFLEMARLGSAVWKVAFQIAAPVTVAIFVQNVASGVLGRAMPQLNILIVNLPLHVGIVFLMIGLGADDLLHAMKDAIEIWPDTVFGVLAGVSDGR